MFEIVFKEKKTELDVHEKLEVVKKEHSETAAEIAAEIAAETASEPTLMPDTETFTEERYFFLKYKKLGFTEAEKQLYCNLVGTIPESYFDVFSLQDNKLVINSYNFANVYKIFSEYFDKSADILYLDLKSCYKFMWNKLHNDLKLNSVSISLMNFSSFCDIVDKLCKQFVDSNTTTEAQKIQSQMFSEAFDIDELNTIFSDVSHIYSIQEKKNADINIKKLVRRKEKQVKRSKPIKSRKLKIVIE